MAINLPIVSKFVDKGVKEAEGAFGGLGKSLGKLGGIIAAAFSVRAITNFAKESVLAAEAVATADARIDQIAQSMGIFGEQTQKVADRLKEYAKANELVLATDENVIKATQAKLLTFKEIALTADEAGGAFDRATAAAIDLAAAGFGSAEGNAVQLGKALNDPIKGISALTRVGVTFTKDQKNLIKAMVETSEASAAVAVGLFDTEKAYNDFVKAQLKAGKSAQEIDAIFREQLTPAQFELMQQLASTSDMVGAQDMVLKALETQVGGTAKATANASDRMKLAFGNIKESVGAALMPAFAALTEAMFPIVADLAPKLAEVFSGLTPIIVKLSAQLPRLMDALFPLIPVFAEIILMVFDLAVELVPLFIEILNLLLPLIKDLVPVFIELAKQILPLITMILPPLVDIIKTGLVPIMQFLTKVMIDIIESGVTFLMEGLTNLGGFFGTFAKVVGDIWRGISNTIKGVINGILGFIQAMVNGVIDGVNAVIRAINSIKVDIPSWIPFFGGQSFGFNLAQLGRVNIPRLADGGIVMPKPGGVLANLAEAGKPEVVIPLDRLGSMGGEKTVNYNITVNAGMGADGQDLGRVIVDQILRYERSSGRVFARA